MIHELAQRVGGVVKVYMADSSISKYIFTRPR